MAFCWVGAASCDLMPPEPLPWDRKDFYKERKHERTQSLPQQPLTARWRESSSVSPYQHASFREFTRWGSADFRRPPGKFFQSFFVSFVSPAFCYFNPYHLRVRILPAWIWCGGLFIIIIFWCWKLRTGQICGFLSFCLVSFGNIWFFLFISF